MCILLISKRLNNSNHIKSRIFKMTPLLLYFGGIIIVILLFILKLFVRFDSAFDEVSKNIPGPPRLPIVGNTFQFAVSSENFLPLLDKWVATYGHRFIYRVGTYWVVALSNPSDLEKLLTSTTETIKSVDYDQLIPWLGTGLLTSNGEKWANRRKLLTPAFHFKILEKFIDVFNQQSFKFVDIVKRKYNAGDEFDINPLISKLTLDIICETAMGISINAQEKESESEYISAITRMKYLQQYRAFRPWLEPTIIWNVFSYGREEKKLFKIAHEFTNKKKQEFQESLNKSDKKLCTNDDKDTLSVYGSRKRSAFLDLLLEAQHSGDLKSDEDVREETDTFMFEGHDTVSAGIGFALFLIGNHPDVQSKIQQELQDVFGEDKTRPVTTQDLAKLKYLECCIKESLRLCPSVPVIARTIQKNFELEKGVVLPPETLVVILPYQLHRNKEIYPDALSFQPERFLLEKAAARHPFSYVPFSAGSRNCIGQKFAIMEEKVVLANVLRNFQITSTETLEDLTLLSDRILHSKHGLKIKYSLR